MDQQETPAMMEEIIDVVYGKFKIPADVAAIVETKQFQRLKSLKQLGFLKIDNRTEHEHHRYSHCLGTYHAAGLMLDALEKNTQWLRDNNNQIPIVYRKAVQLAALLHDVAHGPFSHAWEHVVEGYEHETEAFHCIDHIFKQINQQHFPELRDNNNFGIELIKSLIEGRIENFKFSNDLPERYQFIFEIVSNHRSKLDVDKWDYLKRDYYYLKHLSQPNMDFDDVFLQARVSDCGTQIEYRYEDYNKIYNLLRARYEFHVNCYSLPEYLLCDHILSKAVEEVKPKIGNMLVTKIASRYMQEFLQLSDNNMLQLVENSVLSPFLKYETKFIELSEIPEELSSLTKISAEVEIKSVQEYMPHGERISFYGDIRKKHAIVDETKHIKKTYTGYCDHSKQTVYYKVDYK